MADVETFALGDFPLQSGSTLWQARLAYKTYGRLNAARDNAVLIPTFYAGHHTDCELMFTAGRAIDPARHFIVVVNMFGNGLSSSPSNAPVPIDRAAFPRVTIHDNVVAQHRLVTQHLGLARLALVAGFSMGAQQAFHWGALFPESVGAIAAICGTARTSPHNAVFLEGLRAALTADTAFNDGWYAEPENRLRQPSYNLVNSSVSWSSANELNKVTVWGNNLSNSQYTVALASQDTGDFAIYAPPRTYGIKYQRKF